ncbi:ABC transporter ATP-binding protein [Ilyomonas limi]|uniref:ABC transporter ATP-binding protein n=1 Tax=Ilyomonas limi TaxID=2575867 RepID=A0A4U3KXQ9_9BACT|nr:ABC transporter ATP-binding protein [Ilyomonas limi]TKK67182.1 ABC transporter ATP-binding protein [Ilyomonas limi]
MKHLAALNKYFWKYRVRLSLGVLFVVLSNFFDILSPQLSGYIINMVTHAIRQNQGIHEVIKYEESGNYNFLVQWFIKWINSSAFTYSSIVILAGVMLLIMALLRGFFMFLMRQTIIVMSRHIEYDQKNEIYQHYQQLNTNFYKTHSTGDMMNRVAEDVSRVRMYAGPAIMYTINLVTTIIFCLFYMFKQNASLTWLVLSPLPILAITIYVVNNVIHKKSEIVQRSLSDLTTNAQESYSGIRVIKSFGQEKNMLGFFKKNSEEYRRNTVSLSKLEAIYFPSMTLMIGLSTLIAILSGSLQVLHGMMPGVIVEFVLYINKLTFPVSAIGWTASMIQRASASQKRINEFLQTQSPITEPEKPVTPVLNGNIVFDDVSFTYPHTGIQALRHFSLAIKEGEKVLILGKTGSGKSTIAQLLLRFYDVDEGKILLNGENIKSIPLRYLREHISYVPQDVFLFSDDITSNINFGLTHAAEAADVQEAAKYASVHNEINNLQHGYQTLVGERGVTLSGGQKQRISIARALMKGASIMLFDDCLSAVDSKTEHDIVNNLRQYLQDKTAIIITHRIFTALNFDKIVVLQDGKVLEKGTHEQLIKQNGEYAELYNLQMNTEQTAQATTEFQ